MLSFIVNCKTRATIRSQFCSKLCHWPPFLLLRTPVLESFSLQLDQSSFPKPAYHLAAKNHSMRLFLLSFPVLFVYPKFCFYLWPFSQLCCDQRIRYLVLVPFSIILVWNTLMWLLVILELSVSFGSDQYFYRGSPNLHPDSVSLIGHLTDSRGKQVSPPSPYVFLNAYFLDS